MYKHSLLYVLDNVTNNAKDCGIYAHCLSCAPTYNLGVVQHMVFDRFGLAQPHNKCILFVSLGFFVETSK